MSDAAAEPGATPAKRRFWPWAVGVLLLAALIGGALGISLGTRQGGPLSAQTGVNGRPTIVLATAVPVASVSVVASPVTAVVPPTVVATSATTEYVVRPGDTLRSIAQEQLGDASLWPKIYELNRDIIGPDPDALHAGTTLQLPQG